MNRRKFFSWLLVCLWMCFIFFLSHQQGSTSSEFSSGIVTIFLNVIEVLFPFFNIQLDSFHFFVRKCAHFFAYFILGILNCYAFRSSNVDGIRQAAYSLVISILYAISDEVHQLFIDGRSGEVRDVMIDSIGALVGIIFYFIIGCMRVYINKRNECL